MSRKPAIMRKSDRSQCWSAKVAVEKTITCRIVRFIVDMEGGLLAFVNPPNWHSQNKLEPKEGEFNGEENCLYLGSK